MTHAELWDRHKAVMPNWLALYYEEPIEIVSLRATIRKRVPQAEPEPIDGAGGLPRERATTSAYSFASGGWREFELIDRESLTIGQRFSGPAIVLDPISTMYLDSGSAATVHKSGSILIRSEE